jgi:hypothetical protein
MHVVNSILIVAMVVLLLVAIVQHLRDANTLKENAGTVAGLVIWLLVVIAIGFQELPWLRGLIDKKS